MKSKLHKLKKTKLLLALCFTGYMAHAQIISTIAGNGTYGYTGNGGQATAAELIAPEAGALDAAGNFYFVDDDGTNAHIRKITTAGIISLVAGNGTEGYSGDGGQATAAALRNPWKVALDLTGNVYIADASNSRIRKVIISTGIISTYAGNGTSGYTGDGGQATAAELGNSRGVAVDANGNVYIADASNSVIRKVTTAGIISTVAGNGTGGFSGDGSQATAAKLAGPSRVAVDAVGNIYISDYGNNRIRKVTTAGIINTVAGNGTSGFSGDGGQATAAELSTATDMSFDASGNLYFSDIWNYRVRMVNPSGIISTIVGNGTAGFSGDGGAPTAAELHGPSVTSDAYGNLWVCDANNYRIRKVSAKCPANAGPNVTDYDNGDGGICNAVSIGQPSISGLTYAWSPTTALSCTNCAQPNSSYYNLSTPEIYTVTVSGSGCVTNTSTVQVITVVPTLTASLPSYTANPGSNIAIADTYMANFTPSYYWYGITQCTSTGGSYPGGYSWNSNYVAGTPSGTLTFPGTSTLSCNTYYNIWFWVGGCVGQWVTTSPSIIQIAPPANAGTNQSNSPSCNCTPATIGTASVTGMTYSWAPSTALSSTASPTPTSSYCATSSHIIYTLTVSYTGCTSTTSTVQVSVPATGPNCGGRLANSSDIETLLPTNFTLYPNPSSSNITLSLYDVAEYINITDMQGRLVFEKKNTDVGEFKLDISKYNKGIYFIRAKIGNTIEKQKLIVE